MKQHVYAVRPRADRKGVNLISESLPFGKLWYGNPEAANNAVGYAKFYSRAHSVLIKVFNEQGTVVETHEQTGDFREP